MKHFFQLLKKQLAIGGRWINVDVIGPENKEQSILMKLNKKDGENDDRNKEFEGNSTEFKAYLDGLSTHARFLRFAKDFRAEEGYKLPFQIITKDGEEYIQTSLQDASEFMSKKEYTDNWYSEMHETFCFRSFSEWKTALEQEGFTIHENSEAFKNEWIINNSYKGKVTLFDLEGNPIEYPVTNVKIIAEKQS